MISVYVHFPWCLQKCPYCDFASSGIRRQDVPQEAYAEAVLAELGRRRAALRDEGLASVFFGGGTPSLWEPAQLGRVLSAVRDSFADEAATLEVTVECNPTSFDRERAEALRAAGVNRLSLGIQSLHDQHLRFLGRLHNHAGALAALRAACAVMERVSGDLMFGMPGQSAAQAAAEAGRLADEGLDHLSAYSLTIEPETQCGALNRKGRLQLAPEEETASAFESIRHALAERGFEHYEVSNYARPGEHSVHNLHYWQGGAYLGLGAGAVGCLHTAPGRARRYRNDPRPERYLETSAADEVEVFEEALAGEDLVREQLMLGLRTRWGMDLDRARALSGVDPLAGREAAVEAAVGRGDAVVEEGALRVPGRHWLRLDSIVAELF